MGTVIDPDMTEELRVTVVVTGIGHPATGAARSTHVTSLKNSKDGGVDYHQLDRPTFMRQHDAMNKAEDKESTAEREVAEYLDIPAFLRRQDDE